MVLVCKRRRQICLPRTYGYDTNPLTHARMLDRIPVEVVLLVADHVSSPKDPSETINNQIG